MKARQIDWERVPEPVYSGYLERLELVELLLDPHVDAASKDAERERYRQKNRLSARTIRNYLKRYRKHGPLGLLFYWPRPLLPRVGDPALRKKILELVHELPTRSVPQLRRLLAADERFHKQIAQLSDRTLYRFLAENGLSKTERYRLLSATSRSSYRSFEAPCSMALVQGDARDGISDRTLYRFLAENGLSKTERYRLLSATSRSSYRSFEAPCSMALVQGDARDGIWLQSPDGSKRKCYLFLWIDDFSRQLLFGKYYFDEKLPCMEDSFRYLLLRYGIPQRLYLDYPEKKQMPKFVGNSFVHKQIALQTSA